MLMFALTLLECIIFHLTGAMTMYDCDCDDCQDMITQLMTDEDAGEEVLEEGGDHYDVVTKKGVVTIHCLCLTLPQSKYQFPSSSTRSYLKDNKKGERKFLNLHG